MNNRPEIGQVVNKTPTNLTRRRETPHFSSEQILMGQPLAKNSTFTYLLIFLIVILFCGILFFSFNNQDISNKIEAKRKQNSSYSSSNTTSTNYLEEENLLREIEKNLDETSDELILDSSERDNFIE